MKTHMLPNGNLKITVDAEERKLLRQLRHEDPDKFDSDSFMHDWFEGFIGNSEYDWAQPEHCGALTSAPMLAIYGEDTQVPEGVDTSMIALTGHWEGIDWYTPVLKCWAFMDYQVISVQEQLLQHGYAVFMSGNDGPAVELEYMDDKIMHVIIPTAQPGINSEVRGPSGDIPIRAIDAWADCADNQGGIIIRGISHKRGVIVQGHVNFTVEAMDSLCAIWQQWRQRHISSE